MVFNYAVQNNLIVANPTLGVKIPKTGLNENRALTLEEELRLLAAVRDFNKPYIATAKQHRLECRKLVLRAPICFPDALKNKNPVISTLI